MATRVRQFVIHGVTESGSRFRPSDWAERLAGVMAQFRPAGCAGNHLTYSPYVLPVVIDGVRGIVVDLRLRDLEPLVQVGVDDGQLVRISPQMAIDRDALETLRQSLAEYFQRAPTAKVGELREQWGISRKHAVPIFEFFDGVHRANR